MLSEMAPTRYILLHRGSFKRLSFSEIEFIALNISTVTRIDRLIVVARCDMTFVNISHPTSGKRDEHWWKCVCAQGCDQRRRLVKPTSMVGGDMNLTYQLIERDLGSARVVDEPPCVSRHSGASDVRTDDQVTNEEPLANQGLTAVSRGYTHDAMVWRVEAECSGG